MPKLYQGKTLFVTVVVLLIALIGIVGLVARTHRWRMLVAGVPSALPSSVPTSAGAAGIRPSDTAIVVAGADQSPLSEAMSTGKLPAAAPMGPDVDFMAIDLAERINKHDKGSLPALLTAIQLAGINVGSTNHSLLIEAAKPEQGITLGDWEVAAMARMFDNNYSISLVDLSDSLSLALGREGLPISAEQIAQQLANDIRRHADDENQRFRFQSRFIIALGRSAASPYDLGQPVNSSNVRLNAIQTVLILRRLAKDFRMAAAREKGGMSTHSSIFATGSIAPSASFVAFSSTDASQAAAVLLFQPALPPCLWDNPYIPSPDEVGVGIGAFHSGILDLWAEGAKTGTHAAEKYAAFASAASVILAYLKFVLVYSTMDVNITMDGTGPLVRTKDRNPGETRQLTAKVRLDLGNAQFVNCIRPVLNAYGFDVDLPADGPLGNAGVQWVMVQGGNAVNVHGGYGITSAIVELVNPGARIQQAGVGVAQITNFTETRTDAGGLAHISVRGAAQDPSLPLKVIPVPKQFRMRTNIQIEPPNLRSTASDAAGILMGPAAILTLPVEMLMKSHWASSPTFTFPVKDWMPCTGKWAGIAEFTHELDTISGGQRKYDPGGTGYRDTTTSDKYSLSTTIAVNSSEGTGSGEAELYRISGIADTIVKADKTEDSIGVKETTCAVHDTSKIQESGEGAGPVQGTVTIRSGTDYVISFDQVPEPTGNSTMHLTRYACGQSDSQTDNGEDVHVPNLAPPYTVTGKINPNEPYLLSGYKREPKGIVAPDGSATEYVTMKWELRRCQ